MGKENLLLDCVSSSSLKATDCEGMSVIVGKKEVIAGNKRGNRGMVEDLERWEEGVNSGEMGMKGRSMLKEDRMWKTYYGINSQVQADQALVCRVALAVVH